MLIRHTLNLLICSKNQIVNNGRIWLAMNYNKLPINRHVLLFKLRNFIAASINLIPHPTDRTLCTLLLKTRRTFVNVNCNEFMKMIFS